LDTPSYENNSENLHNFYMHISTN